MFKRPYIAMAKLPNLTPGLATRFCLSIVVMLMYSHAAAACETHTEPTKSVKEITSAALTLLTAISETSAHEIQFNFENSGRQNWSNLPARLVKPVRSGVRLGDLTSEQRDFAFEFLKAALSQCGFERVQGIIEAANLRSSNGRADKLDWSEVDYCLARIPHKFFKKVFIIRYNDN